MIRQLNNASDIVIRLQGLLYIDAGLVNQNEDPMLRLQFMPSISMIFTSTISFPAGYDQCKMNSRALRVICTQIFLIKIV